MGSLGTSELLIILILVLLVFGGAKLPKLARSLGQAQREFKTGLSDSASEGDKSSAAARSSEGDKSRGAARSSEGDKSSGAERSSDGDKSSGGSGKNGSA